MNKNKICLKGVIAVPEVNVGGELQNLNQSFRNELDLYANVVKVQLSFEDIFGASSSLIFPLRFAPSPASLAATRASTWSSSVSRLRESTQHWSTSQFPELSNA